MPVYDQQYRPGSAGRTTPGLEVGASEISLRRSAQPRRLFSQVAHDCRALRMISIARSCGVQLLEQVAVAQKSCFSTRSEILDDDPLDHSGQCPDVTIT